MVDDAAAHADEDRQRREAIDSRNQLNSIVYQTEKMLNENRDNIDASSVSEIEEALEGAKDVLGNEDTDAATLSAAADKLQATSHAMAEAMYSAASSQGGEAGPDSAPAHDEEEVLEAEVVEDEDDSAPS
jgi:molecular chaperone DnaK